MLTKALKKLLPYRLRRHAEVFLVDHGFPVRKKLGTRGIDQLGYRGYVGRPEAFEAAGRLQYRFLLDRGLAPFHVLCDIGCGSLRGGRYFVEYLNPGNYLGLEAEKELVELGLAHAMSQGILKAKTPEFAFSSGFEFDRFSKSPDFALAVSVFSHLTEHDIRLCLANLARRVTDTCQFFASFFEVPEPYPNFKQSHAHLGFYYTVDQMKGFGLQTGWAPTFVGEWGSLSGQQMMAFAIRK